jgi:hypothetical protein
MTTETTPLLDPDLTDALQHWNQYCDQSRQNALILLNAITPLKDQIQVTGQLLGIAWGNGDTTRRVPSSCLPIAAAATDTACRSLGNSCTG